MPFWMQLYTYLYGYEYAKRKINKKRDLEKEIGVRGNKGIKGLRDTLREIDERNSKNESIDKKKADNNK